MHFRIVSEKLGCRTFQQVEGEEILLPGITGFRFFVHKEYNRKGDRFAVSEFKTGAVISCKGRRSAAIKRAMQNINREGFENFGRMVESEVERTGCTAN